MAAADEQRANAKAKRAKASTSPSSAIAVEEVREELGNRPARYMLGARVGDD